MHLTMVNSRIVVVKSMVLLLLVFIGCSRSPSKKEEDVLSGSAKILVDETIAPIIEDQIAVFQNSYTRTELTMLARPENEVVRDLLNDTAKLAIITRELTQDEENFFKSKTIYPKTVRFATDAIAVITNKRNADSTIRVDDIIRLMKGEAVEGINALVFDNANSSTVAFFKHLAEVKELPKTGIYALKDNAAVVKYVHDYPQSVGVIGINWLNQPSPMIEPYVRDIKLLGVKNQQGKRGDDGFYKPTQSNLALNLYPFTRKLYLINVQGKKAVGTGFSAFLHGERGQRIILKSGLLPDSIPPREIIIRK
ncbi:substrate-binding domain-containing protein [Olivibacter ginsenosidimutans]|uniref:Substrate-binding domain-containing protein n=1 Tax=Olivibacter ginsenosidimutans TaxID=1176537 RepID=A0ABP9AN83_9SPHI